MHTEKKPGKKSYPCNSPVNPSVDFNNLYGNFFYSNAQAAAPIANVLFNTRWLAELLNVKLALNPPSVE